MSVLSTRTIVDERAKHKNNGNETAKLNNNGNDVVKQMNNDQ